MQSADSTNLIISAAVATIVQSVAGLIRLGAAAFARRRG